MTVLEIVELAVLILVILALTTYIVVMAIKHNWLGKLTDSIKCAIKEAEDKYGDGHGQEKKEYVIAKIKEKCEELHIPYEILAKLINKLIDTIVEHHNAFRDKEAK